MVRPIDLVPAYKRVLDHVAEESNCFSPRLLVATQWTEDPWLHSKDPLVLRMQSGEILPIHVYQSILYIDGQLLDESTHYPSMSPASRSILLK